MIITTSQYKLDKSVPYGYMTAGINLSPATEASLVLKRPDMPTMCANAGTCAAVCLKNTGMNVFPANMLARASRTEQFVSSKKEFTLQVIEEIKKAYGRAQKKGLKFAFRPNLLSDRPDLAIALAKALPEVVFYDYTKLDRPWTRTLDNYHLTASFSERMSLTTLINTIDHGVNVAVVFDRVRGDDLPTTYKVRDRVFPVIDGDEHDLRFLDPTGSIVGLRFKGPRKGLQGAIDDGFVLQA